MPGREGPLRTRSNLADAIRPRPGVNDGRVRLAHRDGEKDKTWATRRSGEPDQNRLEVKLRSLARLVNWPSGRYRRHARSNSPTGAAMLPRRPHWGRPAMILLRPRKGALVPRRIVEDASTPPVTLAQLGTVIAVDVNAGHLGGAVLTRMATRSASRSPSTCHWRACLRAPGTGGCGPRSPASSPPPARTGPAPS